jgi:hypothetical protein
LPLGEIGSERARDALVDASRSGMPQEIAALRGEQGGDESEGGPPDPEAGPPAPRPDHLPRVTRTEGATGRGERDHLAP